MARSSNHLLSAISLTAITLNLSFWMIPLILVAVIRPLLTFHWACSICNSATEFIYREAAAFDSWWIRRVLGVRLDIQGPLANHRKRNLIVICNHQTWFDILVLHAAILDRTAIIKFLIKRQLIYVPILGWICLALDFPRLYRGQHPDARSRDYRAIAGATSELNAYPAALLNFAEGTRFTPAKHRAQNAPWRHLLNPRPGGLRIILENSPTDIDILDMTLAYPHPGVSFWRCLGGELDHVKIYLDAFKATDIGDAARWLNERWKIKDELIEAEFTRHDDAGRLASS